MLHDSCYKGQKEKTTAKEFTCSYVKLYSIDPSTQPLLVFIELGYIDKTEGKLLSTNEYTVAWKKDICNGLCTQHLLHSLSPVLSQIKDNHNNDCVICNLRSIQE